jgi:hypothetical protein
VITANTPWRQIPDVDFKVWRDEILGAGGPAEFASSDCWQAALPHSAVLLNKARAESSFASKSNRNSPTLTKNPFSLRRYNADGTIDSVNEDNPNGYLHFATWEDGVRACRLRISDANAFADQTHGARNPYPATVTIADLITAFSPPEYNDTARIIRESVAYLNSIVSSETEAAVEPEGADSMAVTFGRVPKPASINRHIPTKQNTAWDNLGKRAKPPDAVTWHRMIGTLNGTDNYFRTFANARQTKVGALTPIGIGVAETDGKTLAGTIFEWNLCETDTENRAGWANGSVKSPYGDGKKYLDLFGINAVNRDIEAMEISGNYNTPLDPASRDAIVAWTAWRADQYGAWLKERGETFDFTTFPLIPSQNNRSFVIWHQEFTIGTGKVCPGEVVIRETPALIARVADMLRQYQTGEPAPAPAPPAPDPLYAQPIPIPALLQQDWTGDTTPAVVTEEGTEFIFVNDVVRSTVELPRRQQARNDSPVIGPTIPAGTEFTVSWVFRSRSDGKLWYLTPWWTRTPVAQVERIRDAA